MAEAVNMDLGEFILVGDKNYIIETCFKGNISTNKFMIFNIVNEIDIIDFCIDALARGKAEYIIFDEFPVYFQGKILGLKNSDEIGIMNIIDIPFLKNYLFISSYSKRLNTDFDDKKKAIIQADTLMKALDIPKTVVSFISGANTRTDLLEFNIIKMILKDSKLPGIFFYDSLDIELLFSKNNSVNIYNTGINLLIMRNYETAEVFIDTLNSFTNAKVATISVTDKYYVTETNSLKDYPSILFSLMLFSRLDKSTKTVCYQKSHMV